MKTTIEQLKYPLIKSFVSNLENQPRDPAAETKVGFFMSAEDCSQLAGGEGAEGGL